MDLGGTHFSIRDKIIAERAQKEADLGRADVTPELRAHLTAVNEGDFKRRMLAGFEARKEKEESAVVEEKAAASAKEQADAMLEELNFIAQKKYGDDWWQQRPVVLDKFLEFVRQKTREEPGFEEGNTNDLKIMTRLFSKQLIHGRNSPEYEQALEDFTKLRDLRMGLEPTENAIPSGSLSGGWTGVFGTKHQVKVQGTFRLSINSEGLISGSYGGNDSGTLSGKVSSSGAVNVSSGGGAAGKGRWTGTILTNPQGGITGSGTWQQGTSRGSWEGSGR